MHRHCGCRIGFRSCAPRRPAGMESGTGDFVAHRSAGVSRARLRHHAVRRGGRRPDGLIVDWQLYCESAPADTRQLPESLRRERAWGAGVIRSLGADRGFISAANEALPASRNIYDGICPKSPARLKERMSEERFVQRQRRRSQTEGRVGIFKNGFLGRPLRAIVQRKTRHPGRLRSGGFQGSQEQIPITVGRPHRAGCAG